MKIIRLGTTELKKKHLIFSTRDQGEIYFDLFCYFTYTDRNMGKGASPTTFT